MQHDDGRRVARRGPDHAVFEFGCADAQGAGRCEGGHGLAASPSRNLNRWIFPVAVFGKLSTTSIQRGYFHGPIFCLTCSFSASWSPSVSASARSTTKAL